MSSNRISKEGLQLSTLANLSAQLRAEFSALPPAADEHSAQECPLVTSAWWELGEDQVFEVYSSWPFLSPAQQAYFFVGGLSVLLQIAQGLLHDTYSDVCSIFFDGIFNIRPALETSFSVQQLCLLGACLRGMQECIVVDNVATEPGKMVVGDYRGYLGLTEFLEAYCSRIRHEHPF